MVLGSPDPGRARKDGDAGIRRIKLLRVSNQASPVQLLTLHILVTFSDVSNARNLIDLDPSLGGNAAPVAGASALVEVTVATFPLRGAFRC